jgi:hypothetical protein
MTQSRPTEGSKEGRLAEALAHHVKHVVKRSAGQGGIYGEAQADH